MYSTSYMSFHFIIPFHSISSHSIAKASALLSLLPPLLSDPYICLT